MTNPTTTAAIAAAAGVSPTTVRNVLTGRGRHTPTTRHRVLAAVDALDLTPTPDESWMRNAACRGLDPGIFHPDTGGGVAVARKVCALCPVAGECLEYALDNGLDAGVWGGQSKRARLRIRAARARSNRQAVAS